MRGRFLVQTELGQIETILYLFLMFFQGFNFHSFLLDESSALNIYFTLGPAQIYNISDHCFVAIL